MRPEFAAWRYGDQFGRRRKRAIMYGVGGVAVFLGLNIVGAAATGGGGMGGYWIWQIIDSWRNSVTQAKLRPADGRVIKRNKLELPFTHRRPAEDGQGLRLSIRKGKKEVWFEGAEAERFASQIAPRMNSKGGKKQTVQTAVSEIEHYGHPDDFLAQVVTGDRFLGKGRVPGYIDKMPAPTKLALEMALHEEEERRALEGELWRLERAWQEAEEIAAISDRLLLPTDADDFIEKHREDTGGGAKPL